MPKSSLQAAASDPATEDKHEITDAWLRASFMPLLANEAWHDEALRFARQRFSHGRTAVLRLTRHSLWQDLLELQMDCSREIFEIYLAKSRKMLGLVIPRIGEADHEQDRSEAGIDPAHEKPDEAMHRVSEHPAERASAETSQQAV